MAAGQEEGPEASYEERAVLSPLEVERDELGYRLEEVRGRSLRVIRNESPGSAGGVFFVHGGGGRGGQFKHQFKALKKEYEFTDLGLDVPFIPLSLSLSLSLPLSFSPSLFLPLSLTLFLSLSLPPSLPFPLFLSLLPLQFPGGSL